MFPKSGSNRIGFPAILRSERVSLWKDLRTERQPQRGDIFVESAREMNSSSVRSGICRPTGLVTRGRGGVYLMHPQHLPVPGERVVDLGYFLLRLEDVK